MKATELLKAQHEEVKALFKKLENSDDDDKKRELFEELAVNITAHDAIEREIFYPACEEAMGLNDLLGEALVEHGVVEFALYLADEAQGQEDFEFKCTVLKEMLEHHIEDEEKEFFPKAERALGKAQLEALTEPMEARFNEAKEEDFRAPLRENLQQVLAGATKTRKRSAGSGPRSSTRGSAGRAGQKRSAGATRGRSAASAASGRSSSANSRSSTRKGTSTAASSRSSAKKGSSSGSSRSSSGSSRSSSGRSGSRGGSTRRKTSKRAA